MTKEIREYKKELDTLLLQDDNGTDWLHVEKELLWRIQFYQHERFVHLVVSMTVALATVMSFMAIVVIAHGGGTISFPHIALTILFLGLLAPYLGYYYMLENAVQTIYVYYYRVHARSQRETR
ncbi:hypothetical protein FACS1894120_0920 [Clostridia bacterium]|nr:hypothetical protein FACS1894120_0920 [Clostridia bacterium]